MMKKTAPKSKADWWKAHYTAYGLIYQILFSLGALALVLIGIVWYLADRQAAKRPEVAAVILDYSEDPSAPLEPWRDRQALNHILRAALQAQGGQVFLERLNTLKKIGSLEQTDSEEILEMHFSFRRPNLLRYRLTSEHGGVRIGFNGRTAWIQEERSGFFGEPRVLSGADEATLALTSEIALPVDVFFGQPQHMDFVGEEEIDGFPCYVVRFRGPLRPEQLFYVDQESYLVRKRVRSGRFRGDSPTVVSVIFSDFREIDNIFHPHLEEVYFDGELRSRSRIEQFIFNPGIIESFFEIPVH